MKIIAHGIDLVDFPRLEASIERHGERFLNRVFTVKEQSDAKSVKNVTEKLAGRVAAKEAVKPTVASPKDNLFISTP